MQNIIIDLLSKITFQRGFGRQFHSNLCQVIQKLFLFQLCVNQDLVGLDILVPQTDTIFVKSCARFCHGCGVISLLKKWKVGVKSVRGHALLLN